MGLSCRASTGGRHQPCSTLPRPVCRSSSRDATWSDEELDALAERVRAWLDEYARHLALKAVEPTCAHARGGLGDGAQRAVIRAIYAIRRERRRGGEGMAESRASAHGAVEGGLSQDRVPEVAPSQPT